MFTLFALLALSAQASQDFQATAYWIGPLSDKSPEARQVHIDGTSGLAVEQALGECREAGHEHCILMATEARLRDATPSGLLYYRFPVTARVRSFEGTITSSETFGAIRGVSHDARELSPVLQTTLMFRALQDALARCRTRGLVCSIQGFERPTSESYFDLNARRSRYRTHARVTVQGLFIR